ncbi:hypothetical protein F5Y16DRAFT_84041 [Xylariaceae sp. FL0255]|nr:hypothetical protein F5Y16DRAFT_84041 [Xylariaceae sp. FL0255]
MSADADESYVERSRNERGVELAYQARGRRLDASVMVGLSFLVNGQQAHLDYTSGIDTTSIRRRLASWRKLNLASLLPRIWPAPTKEVLNNDAGKEKGEAGDRIPEDEVGPERLANLTDDLVRVAPMDFQCRPGLSVNDETPEVRSARIVAEYENKLGYFAPVLERLDTRAMAQLALKTLRGRHPENCPSTPLPLPQISQPFFGSNHVFFVVHFSKKDGIREAVRWIVKIPAMTDVREGWDEVATGAVRREVLLLNKLKNETTIPVPELIWADDDPGNELNAPCLMMEYVQGKRLEDVWFGHDMPGGSMRAGPLRARRRKILKNVAKAMLQLGRYQFDTGGVPVIVDHSGDLVNMAGPSRELDVQAMVHRWLHNERAGCLPLHVDMGPWNETKAMYTAMLDTYQARTEEEEGFDWLLRMLVRQIREPVTEHGRRFVLTHRDLSMRNIILKDDCCSIKAILGWDEARAVPHSMGNESFPIWLVRDFNPFVWGWKAPAGSTSGGGGDDCNRFEDAPWVLRALREDYVQMVRELKGDHDKDAGLTTTSQSLLALSLDAAIRDPRCRTAVLRRVLEKCSRALEEPLSLESLVDRRTDGCTLACLRKNVAELTARGFVKGAMVW